MNAQEIKDRSRGVLRLCSHEMIPIIMFTPLNHRTEQQITTGGDLFRITSRANSDPKDIAWGEKDFEISLEDFRHIQGPGQSYFNVESHCQRTISSGSGSQDIWNLWEKHRASAVPSRRDAQMESEHWKSAGKEPPGDSHSSYCGARDAYPSS